jgi:opacity protein-like surface antigen
MIVVALLALSPAWAAGEESQYKNPTGWGVRLGLSDDPDQVVVGVQYDFGEILKDVHFEPNFEIGIGDDHTILSGTAAVHYHFMDVERIRFYAGGGVALGWVDIDRRGVEDDSEFEVGIKAMGGILFPLKNRRDFFAELDIGVGDLQEIQVMVGWRF